MRLYIIAATNTNLYADACVSLAQIEEVQGVTQVLDQEEEIAMKEFAKFEEKLKLQKGAEPTPSPASSNSDPDRVSA